MERARKANNWHYNKNLKMLARKLRNNMTKAEVCIWKFLLNQRKYGLQFTRQRPVLKYIADFMCKDLNLIIEIDGISHHSEEAQQKDRIRQEELEAVGFRVIRFEDEEVLCDIINVHRVIEDNINELKKMQNFK
jgi:very-short-patch-repair endonuclease